MKVVNREDLVEPDVNQVFGYFLIAFGAIFGGVGLLMTLAGGISFTLGFAIGGGACLLTGIVMVILAKVRKNKPKAAGEQQPVYAVISGGAENGQPLMKRVDIDMSYDPKTGEGNIKAAKLCGIGFLLFGGSFVLIGAFMGIPYLGIFFILIGGLFVGLGIYAIVLWLVRRNKSPKTYTEQAEQSGQTSANEEIEQTNLEKQE